MPAISRELQTLVDFGLFDDTAVSRLATLIRQIQAIAADSGGAQPSQRRGRGARGRRRGARAARRGRPAGSKSRRAKRGKFNPTKQALLSMREKMTTKEIANKYRVSMATVGLRIRAFGLARKRAS